MNHSRARLLCIADVPNWIFQRHVETLQRFLSDEFEISISYRGQAYLENDYDLIYPLEFMLIQPDQIVQPHKYVTGIRSFIAWAEWDFLALTDILRTRFQRVHVVSRELYNIFSPFIPGLVHLSHGVDLELFKPRAPVRAEAGRLRLGWAGNRITPVKGFAEFIAPLAELPGVELVFHGLNDHHLRLEQMPGFYETIDAYICASSYEGNNNSLMEAAAMERAIITTPVGAAPEYLEDRHSALIVERNLKQFIRAAATLRDDPVLRTELGRQARHSLVERGWDWRVRAEAYREFFREALERSAIATEWPPAPPAVDPAHLADVLYAQHDVLRQVHIGDRIWIADLEAQLKLQTWEATKGRELLETEIAALRASETYRLAMKISGSRPVRALAGVIKRLKPSH